MIIRNYHTGETIANLSNSRLLYPWCNTHNMLPQRQITARGQVVCYVILANEVGK